MTLSPKPEKKQRTALSSSSDRATVHDNMYRKFRELWRVFFEICERTDRQTYSTTIAIIRRTRPGGWRVITTATERKMHRFLARCSWFLRVGRALHNNSAVNQCHCLSRGFFFASSKARWRITSRHERSSWLSQCSVELCAGETATHTINQSSFIKWLMLRTRPPQDGDTHQPNYYH